jgi:hypothetical protein
MAIDEIVKLIDAEISKRENDKFGIKVSENLFNKLCEEELISNEIFSAFGTGAFAMNLPAYRKKYFIFPDFELEEFQFRVGAARK